MARNYVKKGYTENQKLVSAWISRNGVGLVRKDSQLRCYITKGTSSAWYEVAQTKGTYIGGGTFNFTGTGGGRGVDYIAHSRFCGILYNVRDARRTRRSRDFPS
jgi:hypothetical protein